MILEFIKKDLIMHKRYLLNSVVGILIIMFMFALIYLGIGSIGGNFMSENSIPALVVSYLTWVLAISAFQTAADFIITESIEGTIQTLYQSRFSFLGLVMRRIISGAISDMVLFFMLMFFCSLITGVKLNIDISFLAVVVLISFEAYWGLGLVVGGLALLFKRVSSLSQLLSFAFMGVMVLPIDKINQVAFLPGGAGRYFLNNIVVNHARICQIPIYEWAYLIIPNIIYLALGMIAFKLMLNKAVKNGTIGHF